MAVDYVNILLFENLLKQEVIETVGAINDIEIFMVGQIKVVELDSLVVLDTHMTGVMMSNDDDFVDLVFEMLCKFEDMNFNTTQKGIAKI